MRFLTFHDLENILEALKKNQSEWVTFDKVRKCQSDDLMTWHHVRWPEAPLVPKNLSIALDTIYDQFYFILEP